MGPGFPLTQAGKIHYYYKSAYSQLVVKTSRGSCRRHERGVEQLISCGGRGVISHLHDIASSQRRVCELGQFYLFWPVVMVTAAVAGLSPVSILYSCSVCLCVAMDSKSSAVSMTVVAAVVSASVVVISLIIVVIVLLVCRCVRRKSHRRRLLRQQYHAEVRLSLYVYSH